MTKQEAKKNAEIMLAWAERGATIQSKARFEPDDLYINVGEPSFNFKNWQYRIKPITFPPPPEGEAWQNPDNLTDEQVGEGYRLLLQSEVHGGHMDSSIISGWSKERRWMDKLWGASENVTYRVPSATPFHWGSPKEEPWSLGRELPGFRPLRDGEEWHRNDGWEEEDLSGGWRPLIMGEDLKCEKGDQYFYRGQWTSFVGLISCSMKMRTQRSLPEPVKMVPLEAGDIPPGSVFRDPSSNYIHWESVSYVQDNGVYLANVGWRLFDWIKECNWEILRPGSSTWEKCEKEEVKP